MKHIALSLLFASFYLLVSAQDNHPVSWKFSAEKTGPSTYQLMMTALVKAPFHIYPQQSSGGGLGMPTEIIFTPNDNVEFVGETGEKGLEDAGTEAPAHYKKGVTFSQMLKLKTEKPTTLSFRIKYMACNDLMCLPPSDKQFTFELNGDEQSGKETGTTATAAVARDVVYEDFMMADTAGRPLSSKDIRTKAKYTFIDFWASWCVPCRELGRTIVPLYASYKPKGFEVIGVSLDTNPAAWKKAIRTDGYQWQNISDLKGFDSAIIKKYEITAIPRNILIDANGKIVARDLHADALAAKLSELFNSQSSD